MKKSILFLVVFFASLAAWSQDASRVSAILKKSEITCGEAAYLAAVYSGAVKETASYEAALQAMNKAGVVKCYRVSYVATLSELSAMFVYATGIKCGLFYRITKSSRYAFKELKAKKILDNAADPSMTVSGQNAIAILNGCIKAGGAK